MTDFEKLKNVFIQLGIQCLINSSELFFEGKKISVLVNSNQMVDYHFRKDGKYMTVLICNA